MRFTVAKRPWLNREVFGWGMFDFANQSFTLVILTAMFQVYFVNQVVVDDESLGRQLWATSGIISLILVIAVSPVIGALADFSGAKKKLLFISYLACVALTASLGLITPGAVALAMVLFVCAYIFYATGENFLGSFLPELAAHRDMGKVSAFGWTLGYVGGLLCLAGAAGITALFPENAAVLINQGNGSFGERIGLRVAVDSNRIDEEGPQAAMKRVVREAFKAEQSADADAGLLSLPSIVEVAGGLAYVAVVDLDGDGADELAAPDRLPDQLVIYERTHTSWRERSRIDIDDDPVAVAADDVDADGHPDLAVGCSGKNVVRLLLNDGDGSFEPGPRLSGGDGVRNVHLADVNGDGALDVVTRRAATHATGYRFVVLWAGIFFGLAGLPTFLFVRERKQAEDLPEGQTIWTIGFARLADTFRDISGYRHLFRFLAIMTFYLAGMQVVIWFAGTITKELFNFSDVKMSLFMLQITVTAIVGALITGRIQDRIGTRNTIHIALVMWGVVMLAAAFIESEPVFWILANGVGLGMGALGTASRSMVGLFSPAHKSAEFFGFYGLAHKVSVILGLGLTIVAEQVFPQSYNLVVASSSIFFFGGIALLFTVSEKQGRVTALRMTREHIRKHHDFKGGLPGLDESSEANALPDA
jgi:MFS-type transporter involved in bile tolerance (Atg22 family)